MNKIYTFGCSFTYGQGFPDSLHAGKEYPTSMYAWPNVLKNLVDQEVINLSWGGASMLYIQRSFCMNMDKFNEGDTIIIQWPFLSRWSVIRGSDIGDIFNMTPGPVDLDEGLPHWDRYTSEFSNVRHEVEMFCMISYSIQNICKNKKLNFVQRIFDDNDLRNIKKYKPDWYNIKVPNLSLKCCLIDINKARLDKLLNVNMGHLPDLHLNEGCHIYWAHSILNELKRLQVF